MIPFKSCGCCGHKYTFDEWQALPSKGHNVVPAGSAGADRWPTYVVQLRNCTSPTCKNCKNDESSSCKTTMAVEIHGNVTEAA